MNQSERWNLAVKAADSILDDFSDSLHRAVALFGSKEEALKSLILPEITSALGISIGEGAAIPVNSYTGESRNLYELLNHDVPMLRSDWNYVALIEKISAIVEQGAARRVFKPNDYFFIPISIPAAQLDGVEFPEIKGNNVKVVITHVFENQSTKESGVIFNIENVLFHAPMNNECTNKGGLEKSILAKYLNTYFLKHVFIQVEDYLLPNKDGLKISLPTMREVFGDEKYKKVNWGDIVRHPYFVKCTHRIKVNNDDPDDTNWWWLADEYAATASDFCSVNTYGDASDDDATNTSGGVAPAFCVARRHN